MGRLAVQPPNRVQRFKDNIGQLVYASGGSPGINLPQNDYTTALELISAQQVVCGATAPVVAGYGAWGPLGLVQVALPGGRTPYSLSGYQGDIYSRIRSAPYASQMTANPVVVSVTNNWANHLRIPFTLTDDTERGAWYTGDTTVQMKVLVQCAPATQVFSTVNGATIQGSWTVIREFFNAPAPNLSAVWLDAISWYHEVQQVATLNLINGQVTLDLQRDVDYQRIFFTFYTGSDQTSTFAPADGLYNTIDLGIDTTIHIFNTIPELSIRFEGLETYDTILPAGTAVLDFERIRDSIRDILPTDTDTVTLVRLTITAPGANVVDVMTERVSDNPFAAKWISMASAQGGSSTSGQVAA